MKNIKLLSAIFLAVSLFSSPDVEASVSSVSGSTVTKNVTKVELRTAYGLDNERASKDDILFTRIAVSHGFTDNFGIEIVANQKDPKNDSFEHDNLSFRINYQLFDIESDGFNGATRLSYDIDDGDKGADEIELRFMSEYKQGKYSFRNNIILENEVGPLATSGLQAELRWQALKTVDIGLERKVKLGFEMFNDFKNLRFIDDQFNQDHEIGPVIKGRFSDSVSYQAGVLFGLNDDATDTAFRFFVSKKF